jgi:hypothetical protein
MAGPSGGGRATMASGLMAYGGGGGGGSGQTTSSSSGGQQQILYCNGPGPPAQTIEEQIKQIDRISKVIKISIFGILCHFHVDSIDPFTNLLEKIESPINFGHNSARRLWILEGNMLFEKGKVSSTKWPY